MNFVLKLALSLFVASSFSLWADLLTEDPPEPWENGCCPPCGSSCVPIEEIIPPYSPNEHLVVDLLNPTYVDGVLSTEEGGILIGAGIRIQAQRIFYTRRTDEDSSTHTVYCEGDLAIEFQGRLLTGFSLFFDFETQTGVLTQGRFAAPPWYVGGDELILCPSGDVMVNGGFITTAQGNERDVVIVAESLTVTRERILTAKNVRFRLQKAPFFWLPKLQLDLHSYDSSPFAVTFGWGGFTGTHLGVRYHFLDWNDFQGYARVDAFFGQGLGAGIETEYCPSDLCLKWYTRNYYAHDLAIFDPNHRDRYRFQGTFFEGFTPCTTLSAQYDFVSDGEMASDYQLDDFADNTAERTEIYFRHEQLDWIGTLQAFIRVNDFQTINQELPSLFWTLHPFELGETGWITQGCFKASYLDYEFSDDVLGATNFHSGRFEASPCIYRPFHFNFFTLTPEAAFIGIAYSNSPSGSAVGQAVADLSLRAETAFYQCYPFGKHVIQPYAHYHFLSNPRSGMDNHYIFTIQDAYDKLQITRFGVRQSFFSLDCPLLCRPLFVDIWANAYFDTPTVQQCIQKGYFSIEWQPTLFLLLNSQLGWNFQEKQLDFSNTWIEWTLSAHSAFGLEYRHRSRFDWRKADFYNFLLESVRPQDELLDSPLSDRRDTFLARFFYRPNPNWHYKFYLRHGWNRLDQPHYTEYQIDVGTRIYQHWRLNFTYEAREADDRYYFSLRLDPSPPRICCR